MTRPQHTDPAMLLPYDREAIADAFKITEVLVRLEVMPTHYAEALKTHLQHYRNDLESSREDTRAREVFNALIWACNDTIQEEMED